MVKKLSVGVFIAFLLLISTITFCQDYKKIKVKKSYLGMTLIDLIQLYGIDTTNRFPTLEPPGVARGIQVEMKDSTIIYLQIVRKEFDNYPVDLREILNEKVIGIGVAYKNCKRKIIGTGFIWWGVTNRHCKKLY